MQILCFKFPNIIRSYDSYHCARASSQHVLSVSAHRQADQVVCLSVVFRWSAGVYYVVTYAKYVCELCGNRGS